ncbi:SET domain-containing protein SmydA-8 [Episyrphus balteatus]|uniref:SET domain-containing protein SmydA-8 n=1 Tax=Episyrphus balteatus TaxID=286459 RepID=UPI0024865C74|nr:SET domain-containing protein SmydA-8 [Episyrphus balteatus]
MPQNTRHKKNKHQKHKKLVSSSTTPEEEPENDLPYKVEISEVMGRYLVASRNLEAGEPIIEELPLAIGPSANSEAVCLGCYIPVKLTLSQYKCSECKWPLCSPECRGIGQVTGHTSYECKFLKEKNSAVDLLATASLTTIKSLYELILPIRILLMKTHRPDDYNVILSMEAHLKLRRLNNVLWEHYQKTIVNKLRDDWNTKDYSEEDIHTICGIIDVNCFEIGQNSAKARAIFPSAFLLSHDCVPNTAHTDHPKTFSILLRTSRKIKKGESITLSYAYTLQGTFKRRDFMHAGKLFWCQCKRCSDPTELKTDCSTLVCPECSKGSVRSSNPLDQEADWKCDRCSYKLCAKSLENLLDKLNNELESIDPHDVNGLEGFLKKYQNILRPNHYLLLSAKYSLCQVYGRTDGYLIHEMSLEDIKRKEKYCRDFLSVIDVLEPGLTRLRGLIMYELHAPIMVLSTRFIQNKLITRNEFQRNLKEVARLLKESRDMLKMEPEGSNEYMMGQAAEEALQGMGMV